MLKLIYHINQDPDSKFQPNQNPPLPEIEKANKIKYGHNNAPMVVILSK